MIYFGCDLSSEEYIQKGLKIPSEHRQKEADLIKSRWFDYCQLQPTQATYCFAHFYKQQTRKFVEAYVDKETAEKTLAFAPADIFEGRDMTSMWRARQLADTIGVPYDFFLQQAHRRAFQAGFRRFLRPNQLYTEELELDVREAWAVTLRISLRYSRNPAVIATAPNTAVKLRHEAFVIDQVRRRHSEQQARLLGRLVHEGVLDLRRLEGQFPEAVSFLARRTAQDLAISHR